MGLFSFLKNAGAKLLGRGAASNDASTSVDRAAALRNMINNSGVGIDNLDIELDGDKVTVYGQTESVEDKEKIILVAGNVEGIATVDDRISVVAAVTSVFHEVKSGDTLSKISKDVYGDPMKYNVIFEANRPMLTHPDKIYPGQMLRIPSL